MIAALFIIVVTVAFGGMLIVMGERNKADVAAEQAAAAAKLEPTP